MTSIGDEVFSVCTSLKSITIPASVTWIGNYTFYGCTGLTTVNYKGTEQQWDTMVQGIGEENQCLLNANIVYGYTGA